MGHLFMKVYDGRAMLYIGLDSRMPIRAIREIPPGAGNPEAAAQIILDNGAALDLPRFSTEELADTIERLWKINADEDRQARGEQPRARLFSRVFPGGYTAPSGDAYPHRSDPDHDPSGSDRGGRGDGSPDPA